MRPTPGELVGGKYRLVRHLGDGGMGAVFEARHERLGTALAVKFLHEDLLRRSNLATRFAQEAQVSARIESPFVARVTDVDETPDGTPYLVMELLVGETLQALLDRERRLPPEVAVDFAIQILAGLEAAHRIGVVHRDLKPDNVFVTQSAHGTQLKLLDFGIAKLKAAVGSKGLTVPGSIMGTPEYMAPEQLYSADKVDARADLFALGVMLYEMVAGVRPARGDGPAEIITQYARGTIPPLQELVPTLPSGLAEIIHCALQADSANRFASADAFRTALLPYASGLSPAGRIAASSTPVMLTSAGVAYPQHTPVMASHVPAGSTPVMAHPGAGPSRALPVSQHGSSAAMVGAPGVNVSTSAMAAVPMLEKGSTQDVSPDVILARVRQDTFSGYGAAPPGAPAGGGAGPGGAMPGPAYGAPYVPLHGYVPPVETPARRPRFGVLVVALLLGALLTGAAILIVLFVDLSALSGTPPAPPMPLPADDSAGTTAERTGGPTAEPSTATAPPTVTTSSRPPTPVPTSPGTSPRPQPTASNGAGGAPPIVITIPSNFPPITLPSGFPKIPGIEFPGMGGPPPQPSR